MYSWLKRGNTNNEEWLKKALEGQMRAMEVSRDNNKGLRLNASSGELEGFLQTLRFLNNAVIIGYCGG